MGHPIQCAPTYSYSCSNYALGFFSSTLRMGGEWTSSPSLGCGACWKTPAMHFSSAGGRGENASPRLACGFQSPPFLPSPSVTRPSGRPPLRLLYRESIHAEPSSYGASSYHSCRPRGVSPPSNRAKLKGKGGSVVGVVVCKSETSGGGC